jgi:hypothetical protein
MQHEVPVKSNSDKEKAMTKDLKEKGKTELEKQDREENDVINPMSFFSPFLSLRYSYRSMYSDGANTYVKAKERRFENGKIESEDFEGTMDQSVHNQVAKEMYRYLAIQMDFFLRQFSLLWQRPER